ncbi:MAG: putative ABC transporter permease [Clostridia bacterium]|nr:putative ABC transporter permease [Clostridia bacterium]
MGRIKETIIVFGFGCFLYSLVEVIFRGFTHWTMFLTGGVVFCCLYYVFDISCGENIIKGAFLGSVIITTAEYAVGCVLNLGLNMRVWDYSAIPANLFGQICLKFSLGWFALSIFAFFIASLLRQKLRSDF